MCPDLAINHINTYSSHHTDSVITASEQVAEEFQRRVDSAGVYWNASTRYLSTLVPLPLYHFPILHHLYNGSTLLHSQPSSFRPDSLSISLWHLL